MEQIRAEHLFELNWQLRQDWFDLCGELTDFPRCGTVPDGLCRMHRERMDIAGEVMHRWSAAMSKRR